MRNILHQLQKLLRVSFFILNQYLKILYSYKEVQVFFTDLYVKSRFQGSFSLRRHGLTRHKLETFFPGIELVNTNIYAQHQSLSTDIFSKETKYLVSPNELFTLTAIVKYLCPKKVFEIGTYKGWTLANLCLNLSTETEIFSIDILPLEPEDPFIDGTLKAGNVHRIHANTYEFNFKQYEGLIDFIFIDAGHEREDVINDTVHAMKMLSMNGTIVWHDYNSEHKGVYNYLNELQHKIPVRAIANTSLAIYSRSDLYRNV